MWVALFVIGCACWCAALMVWFYALTDRLPWSPFRKRP